MGAAAACLQHVLRHVVAGVEQIPPRRRDDAGIRVAVMPIDRLKVACGQVIEQPRPQLFGLADDDGVHVLQRLVGQRGGVHSAHHDRDGTGAELVGQFIGPRGCGRHGRQTHQVHLHVGLGRLDGLVNDRHRMVPGSEGRHRHQSQRREQRPPQTAGFAP